MRFYSILLVFVMVFSLVVFTACGGKDKKEDGGNETIGGQTAVEVTKDAEETQNETNVVTESEGLIIESVPEVDTQDYSGETRAPEESKYYSDPSNDNQIHESGSVIPVDPAPDSETEYKPQETVKETKPAETTKPASTMPPPDYVPTPGGIDLPEDIF